MLNEVIENLLLVVKGPGLQFSVDGVRWAQRKIIAVNKRPHLLRVPEDRVRRRDKGRK